MSYVHIKDPEEYVQCPYEKSHVVKMGRFIRHILSCEKNHPCSGLVACPFNYIHKIKKSELGQHVAICPDRVTVEKDHFVSEVETGDLSVPRYENEELIHSPEDDWDNGIVAGAVSGRDGGYNPSNKMNSTKFKNPSTLSGMKPAAKKAYRKEISNNCAENTHNGRRFEDSFKEVPSLIERTGKMKVRSNFALSSGQGEHGDSSSDEGPQQKVAEEDDDDGFTPVSYRKRSSRPQSSLSASSRPQSSLSGSSNNFPSLNGNSFTAGRGGLFTAGRGGSRPGSAASSSSTGSTMPKGRGRGIFSLL